MILWNLQTNSYKDHKQNYTIICDSSMEISAIQLAKKFKQKKKGQNILFRNKY